MPAVAGRADEEDRAAPSTAALQDKCCWTCAGPKAMMGWLFCVLLTQVMALRLRVASRGLILFIPMPSTVVPRCVRPDVNANDAHDGGHAHL